MSCHMCTWLLRHPVAHLTCSQLSHCCNSACVEAVAQSKTPTVIHTWWRNLVLVSALASLTQADSEYDRSRNRARNPPTGGESTGSWRVVFGSSPQLNMLQRTRCCSCEVKMQAAQRPRPSRCRNFVDTKLLGRLVTCDGSDRGWEDSNLVAKTRPTPEDGGDGLCFGEARRLGYR